MAFITWISNLRLTRMLPWWISLKKPPYVMWNFILHLARTNPMYNWQMTDCLKKDGSSATKLRHRAGKLKIANTSTFIAFFHLTPYLNTRKYLKLILTYRINCFCSEKWRNPMGFLIHEQLVFSRIPRAVASLLLHQKMNNVQIHTFL